MKLAAIADEHHKAAKLWDKAAAIAGRMRAYEREPTPYLQFAEIAATEIAVAKTRELLALRAQEQDPETDERIWELASALQKALDCPATNPHHPHEARATAMRMALEHRLFAWEVER